MIDLEKIKLLINDHFESKGFRNDNLFPMIFYTTNMDSIHIFREFFTKKYSILDLVRFPGNYRISGSKYLSYLNGTKFIFVEDWRSNYIEIEIYIIEIIISKLQEHLKDLRFFSFYDHPEDKSPLRNYEFKNNQIIKIWPL